MKSIARRLTRLHERFARAIDPGLAEPMPPIIYNSNPNVNSMHGSGNIINNNHISNNPIVNYIVHASAPKGQAAIQAKIAEVLKACYVPQAVYDAQLNRGCMEGTRVQVLRDIEAWIKNLKAPQIFWLAGVAGVGKSAIAWTICSRISGSPKVVFGGSFFCSRSAGSTAQRDLRCIVPTLAQLLARQSSKFSRALADELSRNPDVLHKQVGAQLEQLIYKPLLALKHSRVPIVFVIDALDECGGQPSVDAADDTESRRIISEMLGALVALARSPVKLPVKFLITFRPETHIRDTPVSDTSLNTILHLHTVNKAQVMADIRLYISTRLSSSHQLRSRFTSDHFDMLTQLCDGLFIVAATALKYTLDSGVDLAMVRFRTLLNATRDGLSSKAATQLDRMYAMIIVDAVKVDETEANELPAMMQILGALISARMALSVAALSDILDLPIEHLRAKFSHLHAVVHVPEDDDETSLRTLHVTFGEYLFDRAANHLRISEPHIHDILARGCLRRMAESDLCFNVSQTRSSFEPNSPTVPDISLSLIYACQHWSHHIYAGSDSSAFDEDIGMVFRPKFLFWLEILSVLGKLGLASALLRIAGLVVNDATVSQFLRDANAFVASSHEAISKSVPHIYLSALPFTPKDSLVYRDFAPLCTGIVFSTTADTDRRASPSRLVATIIGLSGKVRSIAYSPDGHILASGSLDGTVQLWDARTGEEAMTPLQSNEGAVTSVAFTPNGQYIISGTLGGVVYVWSVSTGRTALPPLRGHSDSIYSVAVSPDGTLIASGSFDKTVRLWKVESGLEFTVISGHSNRVNAVAFSPDGRLLAFASDDQTIHLWHLAFGESFANPLTGLKGDVFCLSFSPDGKWLAAGSGNSDALIWDLETLQPSPDVIRNASSVNSIAFSPDGLLLLGGWTTIRCWDPQSRLELASESFAGHSDWVRSIVFSPDGRFLASGSEDRTVRIWDVSGELKSAVRSLQGHNSIVNAVAVSPDGSSIISGLDDYSIRVWDAKTGYERFNPLQGHKGKIFSVSISPDNRLIASASEDHTVRLWSAQTGEPDGEPLYGHEHVVYMVKISPDALYLASGSEDKTVRMWDVATRRAATFGPFPGMEAIFSVAFSPEGRLFAAASGGRIYFWQERTNQLARTPLQANSSTVYSIMFSPDSTRIVSGTADGTVIIWDVSEGHELFSLNAHVRRVRSVAYSPDSRYIVSASWDKTLVLLDAQTGVALVSLFGHGDKVNSVAFMPDGRSIVSGSTDTTIRVWDVEAALLPSVPAEHKLLAVLRGATLMTDGWLVSPSGELLLWLPVEYRGHTLLPPCSQIIGSHQVILESQETENGLHWADRWTECWHGAARPAVRPSS